MLLPRIVWLKTFFKNNYTKDIRRENLWYSTTFRSFFDVIPTGE